MAARFLLDTNICIYIRRRRPPAVLERFRQLEPGEAVLSVITYGELVYGAENSQLREQARRQLAELAGLLPVMELPMRAGELYGSIRVALAAEGGMIGNNDLWIAAHAGPRASFWSPTTNVSFGAFKGWKFRIGRTVRASVGRIALCSSALRQRYSKAGACVGRKSGAHSAGLRLPA
jgi:tRNA(fMet)-specific endonuclease VapC